MTPWGGLPSKRRRLASPALPLRSHPQPSQPLALPPSPASSRRARPLGHPFPRDTPSAASALLELIYNQLLSYSECRPSQECACDREGLRTLSRPPVPPARNTQAQRGLAAWRGIHQEHRIQHIETKLARDLSRDTRPINRTRCRRAGSQFRTNKRLSPLRYVHAVEKLPTADCRAMG